jgi:hypothetical protein
MNNITSILIILLILLVLVILFPQNGIQENMTSGSHSHSHSHNSANLHSSPGEIIGSGGEEQHVKLKPITKLRPVPEPNKHIRLHERQDKHKHKKQITIGGGGHSGSGFDSQMGIDASDMLQDDRRLLPSMSKYEDQVFGRQQSRGDNTQLPLKLEININNNIDRPEKSVQPTQHEKETVVINRMYPEGHIPPPVVDDDDCPSCGVPIVPEYSHADSCRCPRCRDPERKNKKNKKKDQSGLKRVKKNMKYHDNNWLGYYGRMNDPNNLLKKTPENDEILGYRYTKTDSWGMPPTADYCKYHGAGSDTCKKQQEYNETNESKLHRDLLKL